MKIHKVNNNYYLFWCPGCKRAHGIDGTWQYNNDPNNPTISPSIKVNGIKDLTEDEYNRILKGEEIIYTRLLCHSFIKEGKIQFLSDCDHKLAGKTVDLPDWDCTMELS